MIQHLENVVFITPRISLYTGTFRIEESDLGVTKGTLPPKELATLGSMRECSKELLSKGLAIKQAAHRACKEAGIPTNYGFAVHVDHVRDIMSTLESQRMEFLDWKRELLDAIYDDREALCKEFPQYETAIRSKGKSLDYIRAQISFDIDLLRVNMVSDDDNDPLNDSTKGVFNGLSRGLFETVRDFTEEIFRDKKDGNIYVRTLTPFRDELLPKLRRFAFLDGRATVLADKLKVVLDAADTQFAFIKRGKKVLHGSEYDRFMDLVALMRDKDRMMRELALSGFQAAPVVASIPARQPSLPLVVPPPAVQAPPQQAVKSTYPGFRPVLQSDGQRALVF